jgi:glycosyltransferase involved in cell wall biosynthesis
MTVPLVSVCMASYNHAPFIRAAVESVLRQSFTDWELVITDDGSSDGTLAALDGITDDRLRVEGFPENRSACVALNHCIRRARGRFIAVLNSDDAWSPEKLARQLAVMDEQPHTAAVFTLAAMIDERGRLLPADHPGQQTFNQPNRRSDAWLRRLIFQGNCLCHPSVLVRAEVYRDVGLYDECMAQLPDLDMWIRICLRHDIWVIQEPLTLFRLLDRERNASGNRPEVRLRCTVENMLIALKSLRDRPAEMAAVMRSAAHPSGDAARGPLGALLASCDMAALPPGMGAGQFIWMHEQLTASGDWQACRQFIARTGDCDAFGVRAREHLEALLIPARPRMRWWKRLIRGRR